MSFPWAVIQAVLLRSFRSKSLVERSHKTATTINACPWGRGHRVQKFKTATRWKLFDFRCALTKHGTAGGKVQNTLTKQLQKFYLDIDAADALDLRSIQVHFAAHALPCWAATKRSLKCAVPEKIKHGKTIFEPHEIWLVDGNLGHFCAFLSIAEMAPRHLDLQDFWPSAKAASQLVLTQLWTVITVSFSQRSIRYTVYSTCVK